MISVSTFAIKMFAKDTSIFVPIASVCLVKVLLKLKEFSFKISLSISLRK